MVEVVSLAYTTVTDWGTKCHRELVENIARYIFQNLQNINIPWQGNIHRQLDVDNYTLISKNEDNISKTCK